jgi:hypothetical protein
MRILIAITSCHAHRPLQQAQRETWIADIPAEAADYKFFLGSPVIEDSAPDEIFLLPVPDDYLGLIYKTCGLVQWAIGRGYDFLFKCDHDTLVNPRLLLASDFAQHDYVGGLNAPFASGGSGYWLSRRAMNIVAIASPRSGAEDVFVADLMQRNEIPLHDDHRYKFQPGSTIDRDTITYHLGASSRLGRPYEAAQMYEAWREMKALEDARP